MYKGTVLQYLRKYIKNLQSDQLESYLLSGECTLHAIELEPDAIVEWIADLIPYTVEIEKVFCSKVDIKIPWAQIRTKPLLIGIQQMEVTVRVHDFREQDWAVGKAKAQKNSMLQSRIVELDTVLNQSEKTLKQHELSWVDIVSAGMQVRVEYCRVNLRSTSPSRVLLREDHKCSLECPPSQDEGPAPVLASFTIDIEGMFLAPCHHQSGWSVSYVDNPDQVYEYLKEQKILRRSRLLTIKSLNVSAGDRAVVTHSPGFRMRMTSEFACVNLAKNRRRFSIPSFPSSTSSSVWMDRVNVSSKCSCELSALYAVMQDLLAPVIVPAESLSTENRSCHYTFKESEILEAVDSKSCLESLKEHIPLVPPEKERFESLPPIGGKEPKFLKKTAIATSKSAASKSEMKKLFAGLAKEVTANASKVTERTDKLVTHGKKFLSTAIGGFKAAPPSSYSSNNVVLPKEIISEEQGASFAVQGSPQSRVSRLSSLAESEYFTDAVSGDDASPLSDRVSEEERGHWDGFALWTEEEGSQEGSEFELEAQLVVLDKICCKSFFHLHLNELGIVSSLPDNATVSILLRRVDISSESLTGLTENQLSVLSAFSRFPEPFFRKAKLISKNSICHHLEPVHATSSLTAGTVQITLTPPASSPDPMTVLLRISSKNSAAMKSLALKWKSRSSPPTRFLKGHFIESGRFQPFEGCIHGIALSLSGWNSFSDLCTQIITYAGEYPDPSLDPIMRLRLCIRDVELFSAPDLGWRVSLPNGIISRNLSRNQTSFSDLLAGFQTLTPISEVHFGDGGGSEEDGERASADGFPFDGAFTACICGQESTSWSWALPNFFQNEEKKHNIIPFKIKFPSRVLSAGGGGVISERTWRKTLLDDDRNRHILVPETEFSALVDSKLKVAELDVLVEQLRDKYNSAMEETAKRNAFMKEKWAKEAVEVASEESVVEILTQKICALEMLMKQFQDEKATAETACEQIRSVAVTEVAAARRELLEESQKLKFKLDNSVVVQESLADLVASKDKEISLLKRQREFLLGLGVKPACPSVASQTPATAELEK